MKRALIIGIGGQDGSYLADLLLERGYRVHGLYRRSSVDNLQRIAHIKDKVKLHPGDVTDYSSLSRAIAECNPDEIYHEADQDNVDYSLTCPLQSVSVTYGGVANVLKAVKESWNPAARVFIPLSATMYGNQPPPQSERYAFDPQSPYACAKAACYYLCQHYRREYKMWVSCGILFNHDSVRRGSGYLLHKIAKTAVDIAHNKNGVLELSDLNQNVDIGCAKNFVEAIHGMMQYDQPTNCVIATGQGHTVGELARLALEQMRLNGTCLKEIPSNRPGKPPTLIGNIDKIRRVARWNPNRYAPDVLRDLVEHYISTRKA